LHVYSSPNIIGVTKSRRVGWVENVARMERWNHTEGGKKPLGRRRWEDNRPITPEFKDMHWIHPVPDSPVTGC